MTKRVEQIGDATLYLGDCLEILPTLGKASGEQMPEKLINRARNGAARLTYISAEKFTNEVINSLRFDRMVSFRDRFRIPLSDEEVIGAPLYRPAPDSAEMMYMKERRRALGGSLPERRERCGRISAAPSQIRRAP